MSMIEIKGLCKSFGDHEVLKGIDQNVDEGEVLCIVGPSGSGRSTMLRCINRLEEPSGGEIYIDGELVTESNVDAMRTKMGMVFQSFNLFPHKSVLENLTIGPVNVKKEDKKAAEEKDRKATQADRKGKGYREKPPDHPLKQERIFCDR